MLKKSVGIAVLCTLIVSLAHAEQRYNFSLVTKVGRPAPVPNELRQVTNPSINNQGKIAYAGDGIVFLKSGNHVTRIAGFGDAAPGGGQFTFAGTPAINSRGQIVFQGFATAPTGSGLFLYSNNRITQIVKDGAPGFGGTVFGFHPPSINDLGDVAFTADIGVFLKSGNTLTKLAGTGDPAFGGSTFTNFSATTINHSKQVGFSANTSLGTSGVFLSSNGMLTPVAVVGDPSPGGGNFGFFFTFDTLSINNAGQLVFAGFVFFGGPSGIFVYSNGQLSLPIPTDSSFPNGEFIFSAQGPAINDAGDIAFLGSDFGGNGLFLYSGGNVTPFLFQGQRAPDGDTFTSGSNLSMNNSGQIAFAAREFNSAGGVYEYSGGQISRIAGQGDPASCSPVFTSVSVTGFNRQDTVYMLTTTSPGGPGLFTASKSGAQLVAHIGDLMPGGGVYLGLFNGSSFNDLNQVAFDTETSQLQDEIVLKSANGLSKVVRGGDAAPGGGTFFNFNVPSINNLGQIAVPASALPPSLAGMVLYSNGQISELFTQNDLDPNGGVLGTVSFPSLNDNGQIAFYSEDLGNLYLWSQGTISFVVKNGDPAPGGGNLQLTTFDPAFAPILTNNGDILFPASVSTGGSALFLYSHGAVQRIVGTGDAVPGGSTFVSTTEPSINAARQVVFTGQTADGMTTVFLSAGGQLTRVAGNGDSVPGQGKLTAAFDPKINSKGEVAFTGALSTGESAVLIASPKSSH